MTRSGHLMVFLGVFAAVLSVTHFYLYSRIGHYLQLNAGQRRAVALLLGGLAVMTLVALPVSRLLPHRAASWLAWGSFPWMGILLLSLVVMLAVDMFWFLSALVPPHDPARRLVLQRGFGLAALAATATASGVALWGGLRDVAVKEVQVALKRLPQTLDGLRIVQLTDLHIGPMADGAWLRGVVDRVNALKPDLIAVTGDLADGSVDELRGHVASLAELKAPLGVYFITGNHEYYSDVEPWCAHVASLGLRVLRNERVSIAAGAQGESFDLAGVDDWHSNRFAGQGADLTKALAGRDENKALILLAHQPAAVDEAAARGVDLQLSGHTHGGQIWPFTYLVYVQQPYVHGLHRHRDTDTQIYVSSGTGFWGPPMRLGTAAEITHITLRAAG